MDQQIQLCVEVFGFLQISDMGHPPVIGRYTIVQSEGADEGDVSRILLESLTASRTAAIANIYVQLQSDSEDADEKQRTFITHGFICSAVGNCLCLSLFGEENKAVAWLGPFDYLASSGDFEGHEVYNTEKNITPFPVGSMERPSYVVPAASPIGAEFQYFSWLNAPTGPLIDVNKLFRMSKKLPEKLEFFLKELNRVLSIAEVLGWTEMINVIQTLLPTHITQDLDAATLKRVYHTARIKLG